MEKEAFNPAPLWMILAVGNGLNIVLTGAAFILEMSVGSGFAAAIIGGLAVMIGTVMVLFFAFGLRYAWGPHFVILGCLMMTVNAVSVHYSGDYHYLKYADIFRNITAADAAVKTGRIAGFYFASETPRPELAGGSKTFFHHSKTDAGYYHYRLAPVLAPGAKTGTAPVWAVCGGKDRFPDGRYAKHEITGCAELWTRPGGGVIERVVYDGYREAAEESARRHGLELPERPVYVTWAPSVEQEIMKRRGYRDWMFLTGLAAWNALVIIGRAGRLALGKNKKRD
jgi:hypothetical protein